MVFFYRFYLTSNLLLKAGENMYYLFYFLLCKSYCIDDDSEYSSLQILVSVQLVKLWWAGLAAQIVEKRNAYRLLVRKAERKRSLGRSRCR
jgi:hypothetical protein